MDESFKHLHIKFPSESQNRAMTRAMKNFGKNLGKQGTPAESLTMKDLLDRNVFSQVKQQPLEPSLQSKLNKLSVVGVDGRFNQYLEAIARSNLDANAIFDWLIDNKITGLRLVELVGTWYQWNLNAFMDAINIRIKQYPVGNYGDFLRLPSDEIYLEMVKLSPKYIMEQRSKVLEPKKSDKELMQEFIDSL